jgi:hypothetical protein
MIYQELVGMLRFDAVGCERAVRKVFKIVGDDNIAAAHDGCGQDVTVVGIGQRERGNERLIARDKTVAHARVHEGARALEIGPLELRPVSQQRPYPFFMNIGRPFRAEEIGDGKLQQDIPNGGGIENARVKEGRVLTH